MLFPADLASNLMTICMKNWNGQVHIVHKVSQIFPLRVEVKSIYAITASTFILLLTCTCFCTTHAMSYSNFNLMLRCCSFEAMSLSIHKQYASLQQQMGLKAIIQRNTVNNVVEAHCYTF